MYSEIVRLIEEAFPYGVQLGFVNYDDELTNEQAEWYVTGDDERLFDSVIDWEHDNRWDGADWYLEELVRHIRKENPNFDPNEDWFWEVRDILLDLDESDLLGELVKNTSHEVIVGKWVIDEDSAVWGLHDIEGLLEALGAPDTPENREVADELISNAPTDLGMAFSAYKVSPADLHGVKANRPAIHSRWLPVCYGNPFTGAFFAGAFDLGAPAVIPLSELSPVSHLTQWGPEEVFGGFPYELECETTLVEINN